MQDVKWQHLEIASIHIINEWDINGKFDSLSTQQLTLCVPTIKSSTAQLNGFEERKKSSLSNT